MGCRDLVGHTAGGPATCSLGRAEGVSVSPVSAAQLGGVAWSRSCLASADKAAWMATVLVPAAMVPMTLPKSLIGDVFVGFYAWLGSFIIMAIGYILVSLASS